jgi:hypothetical protein
MDFQTSTIEHLNVVSPSDEYFFKKSFNLIIWVLVLVKDFWTLTPQNQFYKALG